MAKYRKVDPRIWNDAKFRNLSDDGKLSFLFVLTHPQMTSLGAMRGTIPGLAAELGWTEARLSKAFREAFQQDMIKHDPKASFLWLPKFLKYNRPESPNVVKAWDNALEVLPECPLFFELLQQVKALLEGYHKGFREALPKAFGKPCPYQEQEQEQEQEKEEETAAAIFEPGKTKKKTPDQVPPEDVFLVCPLVGKQGDFVISKKWVAELQALFPGVDVPQALRNLTAWNQANPKRRKTRKGFPAHVTAWITRDQDKGKCKVDAPEAQVAVQTRRILDQAERKKRTATPMPEELLKRFGRPANPSKDEEESARKRLAEQKRQLGLS